MILTLKRYGHNTIPKSIKSILKTYKYVFNPSFVEYEGICYLAIRVYDESSNSIWSKLYMWSNTLEVIELNLSEKFKDKLQLDKVADPKLFVMNNAVWGTFNSGYEADKDNALVLFKIENLKITDYYNCSYKGRQSVEKNWAFYFYNNEIYALYSLNGLSVLKGQNTQANVMEFFEESREDAMCFGAYTIGTPMVLYKNEYLFFAHRKVTRRGKRLYLGKPFWYQPGEKPKLRAASRNYYVHSYRSLLGVTHKFNPSLISCTYFSGLFLSGKKVILGYGINDVSWRIVKINISKLWR